MDGHVSVVIVYIAGLADGGDRVGLAAVGIADAVHTGDVAITVLDLDEVTYIQHTIFPESIVPAKYISD